MELIKDQLYHIDYRGGYLAEEYYGLGRYIGEVFLDEGKIYYGFILINVKGSSREYPSYIPIEGIQFSTAVEIPTSIFEQSK